MVVYLRLFKIAMLVANLGLKKWAGQPTKGMGWRLKTKPTAVFLGWEENSGEAALLCGSKITINEFP
ncbi:MAG TPA: hypothetical protein ENJ65_01180 [Candidatus Tenderia electrophaga]|uniref:Uncharacterized protein n=1 Tax=Candidatus Tenderia electrophaga TaxID=1748243 RepID=A0A832N5Y0_9GAMM|nr:hypothetical protein [Candidatus Tenderia electrophaga]